VRRTLLVGFLGSGSLFFLSNAHAQDADTSAPAAGQLEEIMVTGTRISRPEFEAPTPVTALSQDQLQNANPGGPADALRQLPILATSTGPRGATGSAGNGGSFLNLRNLGANRTLVLLDGNRFVPTSGSGTVDVSMIPMALVQRTEIVTGGASAAYGSDAVTGVVNFILDRKFTGVKLAAQEGVSTFSDDEETQYSLTYGTKFGSSDQGHFLFSGEHYKSAGIYSLLDRPQGQRSCAPITGSPGGATARIFACDVRSSQANFTGIISAPSALKGTTFDNDGNPIPFHYGNTVSSTTMIGGDGIKPQFVPQQVPQNRNVLYMRGSWAFTDNFDAYVEGNYGASNYEYQIGSYDQNLGATALSIMPDNAFLPASLVASMKGKSFTLNKYFADLPRTWIQNLNETRRAVAGLDGRMGKWNWDFHYEHGENRNRTIATNDENLNNMTLAADAVINPANGQIMCRSTRDVDPNNGCLPFNVMGNAGIAAPADGTGANTVTDAQLAYLTGTDWLHSRVQQDNAALNFNGEPFSIWAGPVSIATGAEWRKESLYQTVAPEGLVLNTASQVPGPFRVGNYTASSGSIRVGEGYVETVVPLARNLPLLKNLDFNGAFRATHYSTSGMAYTWKAGLSWSITDEFRLRATRSRDERAPNLTELYSGAVAGHNSLIDYVKGPTVVNSQALAYVAGNPNLTPEKGDTTTVGFVFSPTWASEWQTSVDYYHINIKDAIVSVGAQTIVKQCSQGNAVDCGLIIRDPAGNLFGVNNNPQNVQSVLMSGVDFETRYRFGLGNLASWLGGDVTLRGILNYVSRYESATLGITTVNLAGDQSHPTTRWTAQVYYDNKPWSLFLQARYTGWGYYDKTTAATDLPQRVLGGQTPIDVNVAYELPFDKTAASIYLNVQNVFNVLPPDFANGNNYDPIGRFYRAGFRVSL